MNDKITSFGKWCRLLRLDKGLSMSEMAKKLGCGQSYISQIELGDANPTLEFLEKCLGAYEISETKKADFLANGLVAALANPKRIDLKLDKVTIIPKEDLAKLLAVLVFNLEYPYPDTTEWGPVAVAINKLTYCINRRSNNLPL